MRHVTFYDSATGLLHGKSVLVSDDSAIELNTPQGHIAIDHPSDGPMLDCMSQKIDLHTGTLVDYQPAAPSADHEWNAGTKRWQLSAPAQSKHDARQSALTQIGALEARQPRAIREAFLGYDGAVARLKDIDDRILVLRQGL